MKKAKVIEVPDGQMDIMDVLAADKRLHFVNYLAYVPAEALMPTECPFHYDQMMEDPRVVAWKEYTFAIYMDLVGSQATKWERACDLFRKARDEQEPVMMKFAAGEEPAGLRFEKQYF